MRAILSLLVYDDDGNNRNDKEHVYYCQLLLAERSERVAWPSEIAPLGTMVDPATPPPPREPCVVVFKG